MEIESNQVIKTEVVQKNKPLVWWKALLFIVVYYILSMIMGIAMGVSLGIFDTLNGTNLMTAFLNQVYYTLLLDAVAFLTSILIFKHVREFLKGAFSFSPLKKGRTYLYLVAGFVLLFVLQYLIMGVLQWEDGKDQIDTFNMDTISFNWLSLTLVYLSFAVITPIKEELLFRGVLYGLLDQKINFWVGLIVSSLIFGFLHVGHILSAALMGGVLVLLYKLTRSLIVPIIFHMIWNSYAVSGLLLFVNNSMQ
nr:type II CAAX endopeptidase family protein [uncultured Bacillus sp.]